MSKIEKHPDFHAMGHHLMRDARKYARVTGLNFFQDSFYKGGFTDRAFEKWEDRKGDIDSGRRVLVKSAFLLNSLDAEDDGNKKITFYSDSEYADIHNNGGTLNIKITKRARAYFWYMHKATGQAKWRAMALTKKDRFTVVIPARPFLKHSETLMADLDDWLLNQILIRFKRH